MSKKILLVEDSPIICMRLKILLSTSSYDLIGDASIGEEAIAMCKKEVPDIVLMDIGLLGNLNGIQTAKKINKFCNCGIIYLTAHSDKAQIEEAKQTNPVGYLIKPYTDFQLLVTLDIGFKLLGKIRRLNHTNKKLSLIARKDYLTNMSNRRDLMEKLDISIHKFKRNKIPFGVILLDIDHFKVINDTYGHDAGDFVLKKLSSFFHKFGRKQDIVGRWGGDEFLWILDSDVTEKGLKDFMKILKNGISKENFIYGKNDIHLSCSFGSCLYDDSYNIRTLVKKADDILYEAKRKKLGYQ